MTYINDTKDIVERTIISNLTNLLDKYSDNLSFTIGNSIPEYDPSWCAQDGYHKSVSQSDEIIRESINKIAKAYTNILFAEVDSE